MYSQPLHKPGRLRDKVLNEGVARQQMTIRSQATYFATSHLIQANTREAGVRAVEQEQLTDFNLG
jgi:hypothetical protein